MSDYNERSCRLCGSLIHHEDNCQMKPDPLSPSPSLLCKVASIAVHADELLSPKGHEFDRHALQSALTDAEVIKWLSAMTKAGMAPVKR